MAAVLDSVASECLIANARVVDEMIVDLYKVRWVFAATRGDLDDRKGECSKARLLRDDDAKALRQVCAAILKFADEPISIQKGSQEGAKMHVRELKERMVLCKVKRYRRRNTFEDVSKIRLHAKSFLHQGERQLHVVALPLLSCVCTCRENSLY